MSMQTTPRSGGTASGLPAGNLSRRSALRGSAAAVALSLAALSGAPVAAQAAPVAIVSPASSDADLIGFANRIGALAHRCRVAADHRSKIEDRVFLSCPWPNSLPKPTEGHFITESTTATATTYTIERPHERDPARLRWEEATAASKAAHEERKRAEEARLGLPEVVRRHDRMMKRCDRWAMQLAAMRPATPDGLTAKTAALQKLIGDHRFSREIEVAHHADLVMSLLADVVRLGAGGQA